MTFSRSGDTITQSGTDADLSGLDGVTGVTTSSVGTGTSLKTIYNVGNAKISVSGDLVVNPLIEQALFGALAPYRTFEVLNGGRLQFGKEITVNGYTETTKGVAAYFSRVPTAGDGFREDTHGGLYVNSGGELAIFGATVSTRLATGLKSGATVTIKDGVIDQSRSEVVDNLQIRWQASSDIDGLTVIGALTTWSTTVPHVQLAGYNPIQMTEPNVMTGRTANDIFLLDGYTGGGQGIIRDATLLNARFQQPRFLNCGIGTAILVDGHGGGTTRGGIVEVVKRLTVTTRDAAGNPLTSSVYIKDYDNGQRRNPTTATRTFTDDREYFRTTVNGVTPSMDVLTGAVVANGGLGGNDGTEGTGEYRWDRRSKNNDNTDTFDIFVWSFAYLPAVITDQLLGIGVKNIDWTLFPDPAITESNTATVAAYTGIAVDHTAETITVSVNHTLEEIYDYLKYQKTLEANISLPTASTNAVTANGTVLDFGDYSLTISADLTRTSKFQSIQTTGTVSITGSFDGAVTDANGVRVTLTSNQDNTSFYTEIINADNSTTENYEAVTNGILAITVPATATLKITAKAYGYRYQKITIDPTSVQTLAINLVKEPNVDDTITPGGNESSSAAATGNLYFNYVDGGKSELVFGVTTTLKGELEDSKAYFDDRITSEAGLQFLHNFDDTITVLDGRAYDIQNDRIVINETYLDFVRQAGLTISQKSFFGAAVYRTDGTAYTAPISNNDDVRIADLAEIFILNADNIARAAQAVTQDQDYLDSVATANSEATRDLILPTVDSVKTDTARIDQTADAIKLETAEIAQILPGVRAETDPILPAINGVKADTVKIDQTVLENKLILQGLPRDFIVTGFESLFDVPLATVETIPNPTPDSTAIINSFTKSGHWEVVFNDMTVNDGNVFIDMPSLNIPYTLQNGERLIVEITIRYENVNGASTRETLKPELEVEIIQGSNIIGKMAHVRRPELVNGLGDAVLDFDFGNTGNHTLSEISVGMAVNSTSTDQVRLIIDSIRVFKLVKRTVDDFKADLTEVEEQTSLTRKYLGNRKRVDTDASTKVYYDDDKTTIILTKNLLDAEGNPTTDQITEETP